MHIFNLYRLPSNEKVTDIDRFMHYELTLCPKTKSTGRKETEREGMCVVDERKNLKSSI